MSVFKTYSKDEIDELFSNFLINSWSYSKISSFSRNEKAFEMSYIFRMPMKSSSTTVGGQAYHSALNFYFSRKKSGESPDIVDLEKAAFEDIDSLHANLWKIQKTTPSVEECRIKATATVNALIKNFISEKGVYEDDLEEIVAVEFYCDEFLTINGIDIPLPCHAKIDLIIRTKQKKLVIIDHKSKASYMGDDEAALSIGTQAMTYVKCYEAKTGERVDEVWFIENKYSQNKDKTPQLKNFRVILDDDTRRLYEALLYEPLGKMIYAISNPDYVYLINDADNYVDKAELYDFWARTMIAEVDDFNIDESKKPLVEKRLKKIRDASLSQISPQVIKKFKENASKFIPYDLSTSDMTASEKIEHILRSFGTIVKVAHEIKGYSSNTYLLEVSAGIKISSLYSHRLDIASALDVQSVRMSQDLVVHEGRSYLAVEVSKKREHDLIFNIAELVDMRIPLGKDNYQNTVIWDLKNHSTPHLLICGATGSGKSVEIRTIIEYTRLLPQVTIVVFDPKYEFGFLRNQGVEVINDIAEIEDRMKLLVDEMNELVRNDQKRYTLVIFDEFADAVANSRSGKELDQYELVTVGNFKDGSPKKKREKVGELNSLEENLRILLQKGRSVGFRIVGATQRASVKVITGDAKVNFPVQICFRVPKETDSRVVLDEAGAEALAGMGDGLIKSPEYKNIVRFQAFYKPD